MTNMFYFKSQFLILISLACITNSMTYAQEGMMDLGSIQVRVSKQTSTDLGNDLNTKALFLSKAGQYEKAEQLYKEALEYWDKNPPVEPHNRVLCLNNFGLLYAHQSKYDQAIPLYQQSLSLAEKVLSENDPSTAITLDNLAQIYSSQGKFKEAEPLYLKALAIEEKSSSLTEQDHAITMFNLSLLYLKSKKYDQCEPLMVKSLAILKRTLGENSPDYLNAYKFYLVLLRETHRPPNLNTSESSLIKVSKRKITDSGNVMANKAALLSNTGHYKEAEELDKAALAFWDKNPPAEPHGPPDCLNDLGITYADQGKDKEAIAFYNRSLILQKKSLLEDDPSIAFTMNNLAEAYCRQGKLKEAKILYLKAIGILQKSPAVANDQFLGYTMFHLATLYLQLKEYEKCESEILQSLSVLKRAFGEKDPRYTEIYEHYLGLLRITNRSQQADILEAQFKQAK